VLALDSESELDRWGEETASLLGHVGLLWASLRLVKIPNKGSEVWDMSWRNHDKKTAGPLNKARPDMVTAITAVPSIL